MTAAPVRTAGLRGAFLIVAIALPVSLSAPPAHAELTAFRQAVAEAAVRDDAVAAFYRDRNYAPLWTDAAAAERRAALFTAFAGAGRHALPVAHYDAQGLIAAFRAARSERDRGVLEVAMTRAFLDYARDLETGILTPSKVDKGIVRDVARRDPRALIDALAAAPSAEAFLHGLMPQSPEYTRLMRAKLDLETTIAQGGWGAPVAARALTPGQTGPAVVALRDRMAAMGYLTRSASMTYDAALQKAVQAFQVEHGLPADGAATADTMVQINRSAEDRLKSVVVAMERERWLNVDRGKRHIWVNLTDFTAKIIDNDKVTFSTRSVIGKNVPDQRTPEFSDEMEFMVVNPSWNVPRSITTKEYLPLMQRNPNAAGHLTIVDRRGRAVPRSAINFSQYTASSFPFAMRQAPSNSNALGLVKFMFPNKYNIYLHDTPSKSLFQHDVRAYSHGCIRLGDPFDFAYALLARQTDDPVGLFKSHLKTGRETTVRLDQPVPVHLDYRTAFTDAKGRVHYRNDIYGRDAAIFDALMQAGVSLDALRG